MKRKKWVILPVAALFAGLLWYSLALHLPAAGEGIITYSYGERSFTDTLSESEANTVRRILNGKFQYSDNPSCGFTEKCAILLDGIPFALACDGCEVVKNCETGKYLSLSEGERSVLEKLFLTRGGIFPCV